MTCFLKPFPFKMSIGDKIILDNISKTFVNQSEDWILYTQVSEEGLHASVPRHMDMNRFTIFCSASLVFLLFCTH